MAGQVTGATIWHINADEPSVLDYNIEFKSAGQVISLYAADEYRSSDHDPVIVDLERGCERLPETLVELRFVAFAMLTLHCFVTAVVQST